MQELTAIVEVDSQGRVTIPPVIRKALNLRRGSIITIAIREVDLPTGKSNRTSWKRAEEIMGKNFFGVEDAVQFLGITPTRQQLSALSDIPFSQDILDKSKDTHILVAVFPISILEIRDRVDRRLFYNHEGAWYNEQAFAKERGEVSWHLVRKTQAGGLASNKWQEQQALFGRDDPVPTAQVMVCAAIGYFLKTGERLVEREYARTSSVDSGGNCVYISEVGLDGLGISDYWDAVRYDNEDLSSPRKL